MSTQRISDPPEENSEVERLALPDTRFILNYSRGIVILAQRWTDGLLEQNKENRKRICICVDIDI